jgi:hypothetical protein
MRAEERSAVTAQEGLAVRGTAGVLTGRVRAGARPLMLPVTLEDGKATFAFYTPSTRDAGEIRIALPLWTAAGEHRATVALPDGEQPLVLNVEPQPLLLFQPPVVSLNGPPDAKIAATVIVSNVGTGSVEIPGNSVVILSADDTLETVINRALRADGKQGERLLDRVVEEWAGRFAGAEMRINVKSGAGVIEPDSERELTLVLICPPDLEMDRTYEGRWDLDGGSLAIAVETGRQS